MSNTKTPVTILTGFLGAGKTTLLNHLLRKNRNKRFIIFENEYGEIGIDSKMVRNTDKTKLFELNDGCICCTLNDELGVVLKRVMEIRDNFDHVIVEATGIANPGDIIKSFVVGDKVPNHFYIDSVICLIDAEWFLKQFEQHNELRRQVAQSDTILVNKTDLVDKQIIGEISSLVKDISPFAKLHIAQQGCVNGVNLLKTDAYGTRNVEKGVSGFTSLTPDLFAVNRTEHRIKSLSFSIAGSMDIEKFTEWIHRFMYINTGSLFRIKGILNNDALNYKVVVQSVYDHCNLEKGSNWEANETRKNSIVFIGMELYEKNIKRDLQALLL